MVIKGVEEHGVALAVDEVEISGSTSPVSRPEAVALWTMGMPGVTNTLPVSRNVS